MTDSSRGNLILDQLPAGDWSELRPYLEHVPMAAGDVLATPTDEISHGYFPTAGAVSVIAGTQGKGIEIALVGREGAIGLELALGRRRSAGTASVVHAAGAAWRAPVLELTRLIDRRPAVRAELLGAVHAYLSEMSETVVAIGNGTIEQRLARRLLALSLRLGSRHLALTHDALARLMAVRRSGITVALHALEGRRVIRTKRSAVEILDYEGLSRTAGSLSRTEPVAPPSR